MIAKKPISVPHHHNIKKAEAKGKIAILQKISMIIFWTNIDLPGVNFSAPLDDRLQRIYHVAAVVVALLPR